MSFVADMRVYINFNLWRKNLLCGDLKKSLDRANSITASLKGVNPVLSEAGYVLVAGSHFFRGEFREALAAAQRAEKVAGLPEVRSSRTFKADINDPLAATLCYRALGEWHSDNAGKGTATMELALREAESVNRSHALVVSLFFAALLAFLHQDKAKCRALVERMLNLCDGPGYRIWQAAGTMFCGWTDGNNEGNRQIAAGIVEWTNRRARLALPLWHEMAARVFIERGEHRGAIEQLNFAMQAVKQTGERWRESQILAIRAFCMVKSGGSKRDAQREHEQAKTLALRQDSQALARGCEEWKW